MYKKELLSNHMITLPMFRLCWAPLVMTKQLSESHNHIESSVENNSLVATLNYTQETDSELDLKYFCTGLTHLFSAGPSTQDFRSQAL